MRAADHGRCRDPTKALDRSGALRVDIKGEFAGILELASESKKPSPVSREGLEQIKLVAGAGFEPATFRL